MEHTKATPNALKMCFDDYNSFGSAAANTKYKLTEFDMQAITALIFGVDPTVRELMGNHLHKFKERDAGAHTKPTLNYQLLTNFTHP
jgi:hypothetical protein